MNDIQCVLHVLTWAAWFVCDDDDDRDDDDGDDDDNGGDDDKNYDGDDDDIHKDINILSSQHTLIWHTHGAY